MEIFGCWIWKSRFEKKTKNLQIKEYQALLCPNTLWPFTTIDKSLSFKPYKLKVQFLNHDSKSTTAFFEPAKSIFFGNKSLIARKKTSPIKWMGFLSGSLFHKNSLSIHKEKCIEAICCYKCKLQYIVWHFVFPM